MRSTARYQSDWTAPAGPQSIANKPNLAPVATSGAYADLTGTPAAVQAASLTTDSSGSVTWTFDTAFPTVPVVVPVAQATLGSTDVINVQLDGAPTTTSAKFKVTRTQQAVVALLGLTILSVPASVGVTVIKAIARIVG